MDVLGDRHECKRALRTCAKCGECRECGVGVVCVCVVVGVKEAKRRRGEEIVRSSEKEGSRS